MLTKTPTKSDGTKGDGSGTTTAAAASKTPSSPSLSSSSSAAAAAATTLPSTPNRPSTDRSITLKNPVGRMFHPVKYGFLNKQSTGLIKKWSKRWFVISDEKTKMYYWNTRENMLSKEAPKGEFDLSNCSISQTENAKKPHSFGLFHTTRKPVHLQAESNADMIDWIKFIKTYCLGLNETVSLADFELLNLIGKGGFGKVIQVRKKDTKKIYALKVLRKERVIESRSVESTKTEHSILKAVDHPFIVKMHYAFQNDDRIFFVMEFVNGGELFTLLQRERRFSVGRARIYTAELLLALDHLHCMGIIYRDLKPENVLIDLEGHIRLTDFGLAKECNCESRHFSMVGTPYYMAPEVILKKGHTKTCDWWSLGIMLYEMLTGLPPFYHSNPKIACSKLVSQDVEVPAALPDVVKSFIMGLLTRDPNSRLGGGEHGGQNLRSHAFFQGLDWGLVLAKKVPTDFVPLVKSATDVSHFDSRFTSDNPELSCARDRGDPDEVFKSYEFDYIAPAYRRQTRVTVTPHVGEDDEWDELVRQSSVCQPAQK